MKIPECKTRSIYRFFTGCFLKLPDIALLLAFIIGSGTVQAQISSREFSSAQEAIVWAQANKTEAAHMKHIIITGNNDKADLYRLKTLNNNSGNGFFSTLQSIELPAQTDTIPNNCFYACYTGAEWLKNFSAPNVTCIGDWAFRACTGLSAVELPAVTSIGAYAFYNAGLNEINLPASLENVGYNPFLGCANLGAIAIDEGNVHFSVEDGVLFNASKTLLITYPAGRTASSFVSGNTVTAVGSNAFGVCGALTDLELPAVTRVGNWASEFCLALKTVGFGVSGVIDFCEDVFLHVTTADTELILNAEGEEFTNNVSGNIWKEYEWKRINRNTSLATSVVQDFSIRCFPNPVRNILRVESTESIHNIAIFDMSAKMVYNASDTANGINMSALPGGLYVVRITTPSEVKKELILKID